MKKIIPEKELISGEAYYGHGRNFNTAIWTGRDFAGIRYKFGDIFIDHEDISSQEGTFSPFERLLKKDAKDTQT